MALPARSPGLRPLALLGTVLLVAVFLAPLVVMVTGSLRAPGLPPPRGVELLPEGAGLAAYVAAFELVPFGRALLNSLLICALAVPLSVLPEQTQAAAKEPTEVTLQLFGDPTEVTGYRQLIAAFEAKNPDVKVRLIPIGKQKDHSAWATAWACCGTACCNSSARRARCTSPPPTSSSRASSARPP